MTFLSAAASGNYAEHLTYIDFQQSVSVVTLILQMMTLRYKEPT